MEEIDVKKLLMIIDGLSGVADELNAAADKLKTAAADTAKLNSSFQADCLKKINTATSDISTNVDNAIKSAIIKRQNDFNDFNSQVAKFYRRAIAHLPPPAVTTKFMYLMITVSVAQLFLFFWFMVKVGMLRF